jgi:hypothetical protein
LSLPLFKLVLSHLNKTRLEKFGPQVFCGLKEDCRPRQKSMAQMLQENVPPHVGGVLAATLISVENMSSTI